MIFWVIFLVIEFLISLDDIHYKKFEIKARLWFILDQYVKDMYWNYSIKCQNFNHINGLFNHLKLLYDLL
jgi:hypothetical protein